ncbi:MAG TPA: DNA gyrase C-terminal beta-propeller domain-containing protein, partial [Chloroflexota bacterium]|nr:DNA gyrase C-terminal beta-propeller domain-containing protein [Chloroflexota bacterium]
LRAITLDDDDELAWVEAGQGDEDILLVTNDGRAIRFAQDDVRSMGRTAAGVYGIKLRNGDRVVAMGLAKPDHDLLVVTQRGIGKRTPVDDYPQQGRNGLGVYTIRNTEKVGQIIAAAVVSHDMEMVLMSAAGQVIRQPVSSMRQIGRNTQGVRLMGLNEGDSVVSMACLTTQGTNGGTAQERAEREDDGASDADAGAESAGVDDAALDPARVADEQDAGEGLRESDAE